MTDPIQFRNDMRVELVQHVGSDESIARAAWISSKGPLATENADPAKQSGLIRALLRGHHGTPFEHASLTFLVEAPIFVFREWHRHRIGFSYNEASARYKKKMDPVFWTPRHDRPLVKEGKGMTPNFVAGSRDQIETTGDMLRQGYSEAWHAYEQMVNAGIANEVARAVLPVGLYSSMYCTTNPRALMHFLGLRTHEPEATFVSYPQREIEECARKLEAEFAKAFPVTHGAFCEFGRVAP